MTPIIYRERAAHLLNEIAASIDGERYLEAADSAAELITTLLQLLMLKHRGIR